MTAPTQLAPAGELPGWARKFGIPLAGFVLVGLFVIRGFPYDALAQRIRDEVARSSGVRVAIAELGPAVGWGGPGLEARGIAATVDGQSLRFDRLFVRPAWSTSWFRGDPALHIEIAGPIGGADGHLEWSDAPRWSGQLLDVDVGQMPLEGLLPRVGIVGRMDATVDVRAADPRPEGAIDFDLRAGSLSLPNVPVALPFEHLTGSLSLGGDVYVEVTALNLEGPIASGSGSGTVGQAASFDRAPLQLDFDLEVKPALAGAVRQAGLRVNRKGSTKVRVSGTVSSPKIR